MFRITFANGQVIFVNARDSQAAYRIASQYGSSNGLGTNFNISTVNANNGPTDDDVVIGTASRDTPPPSLPPVTTGGSTPGEAGGVIDPGGGTGTATPGPVPDYGPTDQFGGAGGTPADNPGFQGDGSVTTQPETPTDTTAFWRIDVGGTNVYFSGTRAQAQQAAANYARQGGGIQTNPDSFNPVQVSVTQFTDNSRFRIREDGSLWGGNGGVGTTGGPGGVGTGDPNEATGAPAATTSPTPTPTAGPVAIDPEAVSPFGAYRNLIQQQGYNPSGVLGSLISDRYGQEIGSFTIQALLSGLDQPLPEGVTPNEAVTAGIDPSSFIDFLSTTDRGSRSQMALEALQLLAAQDPSGLDAEGNPLSVLSVLQGANPEQGGAAGRAASDIEQTALAALGSIYSPVVSDRYGGALIGAGRDRFSQDLVNSAESGTDSPQYVSRLLAYLGLG